MLATGLINCKLLAKQNLSIGQTAQNIAGHKVKHQHMDQSILPFVRIPRERGKTQIIVLQPKEPL